MEVGGGRAYDRADKACQNSRLNAVLSRKGAKSCGECQTVYVTLGGKRPRNINSAKSANSAGEGKQKNVTQNDGVDISWVLTVCRKGKGGKGYANGCSRKSAAAWKGGEDFGQNEHKIKVGYNAKAVYGDVDKADGHSKPVGKVYIVACASEQFSVVSNGFYTENRAYGKGEREENRKEDVHKLAVGVGHSVIFGVVDNRLHGLLCSEDLIHKGVDKDAEYSYGKSCLIHIISAVHCGSSRQKRGDDKAYGKSEQKGKCNSAYSGYSSRR